MANPIDIHHLNIDIFHAVEYNWPRLETPHIAWPRQYALWFIESGELEVQIGDTQWQLQKDTVFLAPMRQPRYLSSTKGVHWWSLNFVPTWYLRIDPLQSLQQPLRLTDPPNFPDLQDYMRQLVRCWMKPWRRGALTPDSMEEYHSLLPGLRKKLSQNDQIICQGLVYAVFGWCLNALQNADVPFYLHQSIPAWLPAAINLIEENPNISAQTLATNVGFSTAQLRRLFHDWLGASPQEFLVTWRMDKAHHLLETTDLSVADVAQELGFASTPSFARIFKKVYGSQPSQVRTNQRVRTKRKKK